MNDSRNLKVLDAAFLLVGEVHRTARSLDSRQVPGLRAQLLRAVDSVPANIAEGARGSRGQFAHFLNTALRSADEVGAHLRIAYHAEALDLAALRRCETKRTVVCRMLTRLIRVLEESEARAQEDAQASRERQPPDSA